jgi:hypothetical protein
VGLQDLEGMLLIRATGGLIEIRDRGGLEEVAANSGYGRAEAEYQRLMILPQTSEAPWHDISHGAQALRRAGAS